MPRKRGKKYNTEISLRRTPGEIVAIRRKKLGWSQEELEWRSGVSVAQISRIENGLCQPTYETIFKLEEALEIDLFDLFVENRESPDEKWEKAQSSRSAVDEFERELAKRKLTNRELRDLLGRALAESEQGDETSGDDDPE